MIKYNWKKFTKKNSKKGNYAISVVKTYSFGFLSLFYKKENIKDFKKVVLFFDKSKKAVAFSFTNDENAEGAFALIHGKSNGTVLARSFFFEHDIKGKMLGKKTPIKEDTKQGTLYIIDLS